MSGRFGEVIAKGDAIVGNLKDDFDWLAVFVGQLECFLIGAVVIVATFCSEYFVVVGDGGDGRAVCEAKVLREVGIVAHEPES